MTNIYYGIKDLPKGKRRPKPREALKKGQTRFWGLKELQPIDLSMYKTERILKSKRPTGKRTQQRYKKVMKMEPRRIKKKKEIQMKKKNYTIYDYAEDLPKLKKLDPYLWSKKTPKHLLIEFEKEFFKLRNEGYSLVDAYKNAMITIL